MQAKIPELFLSRSRSPNTKLQTVKHSGPMDTDMGQRWTCLNVTLGHTIENSC